MIQMLAESAPGNHPTVSICGGSSYLCQYNYDTLISSAIAVVLTLAIGFWVASRLRRGTPRRVQMLFELFLGYVRNLSRETVGTDVPAFVMPLAATVGFFILVSNWLDFFPLSQPVEPPAADLNLTLAMGLVVFILVQGYAIRVRGLGGYLKHYTRPEGMNPIIRTLFIPLNIIEELVKPVTLALRLFGNVFAGILMVYLLGLWFGAWAGHGAVDSILSVIPVAFLVLWKAFDVFFIGTIQAFIFMLLTVIYFGMAREGVEEVGQLEPSHP
jgi:F-type H+-transporting ATPase subunit a